jgi:flagellar hook-length control protein FliK
VRIRLSPPELGDVRVALQQTSAGLIARVVADHATSAQTLQQSAGELRRSLESAGVDLLRLDIGASGDESQGAAGNDQTGEGSGGASTATSDQDQSDGDAEASQTLTLANGAIVDVLA